MVLGLRGQDKKMRIHRTITEWVQNPSKTDMIMNGMEWMGKKKFHMKLFPWCRKKLFRINIEPKIKQARPNYNSEWV